jgi:hypothetical protein
VLVTHDASALAWKFRELVVRQELTGCGENEPRVEGLRSKIATLTTRGDGGRLTWNEPQLVGFGAFEHREKGREIRH